MGMGKGMWMGLVCACLSLVSVPVSGADEMRPYVRLSGIAVLPAESDVEHLVQQGDSGTVDLDSSIGVVGAVGLGWSSGLQAEVEVGYRSLDTGTLTGTIPGLVSGSTDTEGKIETVTIMANGRYVFAPASWVVNPYIGGGLGVALHDGEIGALGLSSEGEDTVVAYQVMVGLEYDVTDAIGSHVGYRYLGTGKFDCISSKTFGTPTQEECHANPAPRLPHPGVLSGSHIGASLLDENEQRSEPPTRNPRLL